MTGLTVGDIAAATGGRLIGGDANAAVTGAVIDSRRAAPGVMFCALRGERVDGHSYIASALSQGSPCVLAERVPEGVDGSVIVVSDVTKAMAALARRCRDMFAGPVVGVVGSSGKTTTKEMCACVLAERFNTLRTEGNLNNELGVPLTLFRIAPDTEAAVVELGISDFGEMHRLGSMARPDIAVYTLIGRSHLNLLHDLDGVLKAKTELLDEMDEGALVIVNGDDQKLASLKPRQRLIKYGLGGGNDVRAENVRLDGGVSFDVVRGERRFTVSVNGRRTSVIRAGGVTIVDDCYNSNPDSAVLAVKSASDLPGRLVCILGDMLNLGPDSAKMHREVGDAARARGALLLCSGEESRAMGGVHFDTREELISALPEYVRPGDVVLVKASHAMGFEAVTEALKELFS